MPWKGQTMEGQRNEFVRRVQAREKSKSALCREYGISRPTGDKWIARSEAGETMADRSRAPFRTPHRILGEMEATIVSLRRKHPAIGAKKLKRMLENQGLSAPAYSTINAVLHRNGLILPEASAAATPHIRFEKKRPNEMWQADFKGHFAMGNGQRCHPLTVVDDHSRYCICLAALNDERLEGVRRCLLQAFDAYGLPDTILCDNGNPWGTVQSTGYTRFEAWLWDLGVLVKHGRIRHPQTQGKNERFNGSLLRERIRYRSFEDYLAAQQDFDDYRSFYNHERPHHSLDLKTPSDRYSPSPRKLPSKIKDWEYGHGELVRQVKPSGYLTFRGQGYFLSEPLANKSVAIVESQQEKEVFLVLYRQFCIAKLNITSRVVIAKSPFRFSYASIP